MGLLEYGLKRTKDTEQIIASIGRMSFYTTNKKETDLKTMLDLLRTFEGGPCPKCERAWPETPSNVLRIRVARRGNKTPPEGRSRHTILC